MSRPQPSLDQMFEALSDATRRAIIERLSKGPASDRELARQLGIPLPLALQSLQILEASGLARIKRVGAGRQCTLQPVALKAVESWIAARGDQSRFGETGFLSPPDSTDES